MSNKKTYRKYAATTIAAAAAVASVAPVATAAETSEGFSDVNENHDFYTEITALTASGFITGFEDGTFRPSNDIKRLQAARIIVNALELEVPEDIEGTLSVYNDVDEESEGADVIAAVTAAGIFGQFASGEGNFGSWNPITREQIASVLVRALDLGQYDTGEEVEINLKGVDASHADNVQILANLGITSGAALDNFQPINSITRGQFAAQVYRTLQVISAPIEEEIEIESVNAVNSKTLEVVFNQGVNADEATLEVIKSTINQNVAETTWSTDGHSVRLELSAKLTEGEYTVNVSGLTEGTLTGSVQVENERVDSIEILSDTAVVNDNSNITSATVAYQVQNQYGEDITRTTNLTTNNTSGITVNPANGVVTIDTNAVGASKIGDQVAVALIHAETATSTTKVVTLSAEATASEVEITGIYNKDGKELNEDTTSNDKFYLLVDVEDQYGNAITNATAAEAGLVKSETNTSVIETAGGTGNDVELTELTIDGEKQLGLELGAPKRAGLSNVTLISTTTGNNTTYTVEVAETTRTDVVTLSAPALAVAGEDFLVPVTVLDKEGNAVTDLKVLNDTLSPVDYKGVKVTFTGGTVTGFVKGDGDDENIYIKVNATAEGTFPLVAQSSTFKVATQTIKVEEAAVPTTVRGLKEPLALAANGNKEITVDDVVLEDQYGREMKTNAVSSYLTAEGKGILVKKVDDSVNVVTLPTTSTITPGGGVTVTAGTANGTQALEFTLANADGTGSVAASAAEATVRVTDGTEYDGYEIAEIGKVQASDVQSAGEKEFTVNGLLNGSKVALDATDDFTATVSGGQLSGSVAVVAGEIDIASTDLNEDDNNDPVDTEFTLRVTVNATGEVLEQKFIVSAEDRVVEDFFFTTSAVANNHDGAKALTEAFVEENATVATSLKDDAGTVVNFATTDQYGNEVIVDGATATPTVTIVPEKASEVIISDNGTSDAEAALRTGFDEAKLTVTVKVGNATEVLNVTLIPSELSKYGHIAYKHLQYLSNTIGSRVAGSDKEREAEQYIKNQFESLGLDTEIQNFSFTRGGSTVNSSNVIAYKPGKSSQQLIVGAHYDSVSVGRGSDDNASGVGVMLEAAEALKDIETPYSIVFIAFGSEEVGLRGSNHYAGEMTPAEVANTIGMINLDSLAAGDNMYVYGSAGENGFIRELALNIVADKKLNVGTNPGNNPTYPEGTTGDWSDHAPFNRIGIPYGYLEATNWALGDQDGYTQTEKHGGIWHTPNDTIEFIEQEFPGRVEEHLSTFSLLLVEVLKNLNSSHTGK